MNERVAIPPSRVTTPEKQTTKSSERGLVERVCRFGRQRHLTGIVFDGTNASQPAARTGLIMLNAGTIHRVGPFQMHTELARQLAGMGIISLRFDLSGLGDSGIPAEQLSHHDRQLADVNDAIAYLLSKQACDNVVLFGLCSGAYLSHRVALGNPKVAGCIFLDGFAFKTMSYYLEQYCLRLLRPRKWLNLSRRILKHDTERHRVSNAANNDDDFFDQPPPPTQLRQDLQAMLDRHMKLQFLFTGGTTHTYASRNQFAEMYGTLAGFPTIDYHFLPHIDHTFWLAHDRLELLGHVIRFLSLFSNASNMLDSRSTLERMASS